VSLKINTSSPEETAEAAKNLINTLTGKTVLLNGNLGAGKTTFVKAFAKASGCKEEGSSPTFTLMQRYRGETDILHFDLYRLNHFEELETIGFFETMEENATKFIEWAEKFSLEDELESFVKIDIKNLGGNKRELHIKE
jgi:tRNA threonylcarbamoyladenosine biosynthesis protein TsaE